MEELRRRLKTLAKRHAMEIIALLTEGPRYISQIAEELGIPYATAQSRVRELENVDLVEVAAAVDAASKRAVRLVRAVNFRLEISPSILRGLMRGEGDLRIPLRRRSPPSDISN